MLAGIYRPITKRPCLLLAGLFIALVAVPVRAADVSGTWHMVWDTEGGIRRTDWKITQEGESITVESEGNVFMGTLKAGRMVVEGRLYSAEAGYTAQLKVEGTLQKDGGLKGRGTWDQYAMTFTAERAK